MKYATQAGGPVLYIVNGEPSVWACELQGVPAVCFCVGEGSLPTAAMLEGLRSSGFKRIAVVYDLDDEGRKGGLAVAAALQAAGLDAVALKLPDGLGAKADVGDLACRVGSGLAAALAALPVLGEDAPQVAEPTRQEVKPSGKRPPIVEDLEPWPETVEGAALLDEVERTILRFVAMPEESAVAVALWIIHAHAHDAFFVSPLLTISSPEKQCGKTTLLNILGVLCPRPLPTSNITPPAIFRAIDKFRPTLLLDEADTFLRGKNADPELRGVINSGHTRRSAFVVRTVGEDHDPKKFSTWTPKAIALIGGLADTLEDRSIMVRMRRRAPHEKVESQRADRLEELATPARKAARWAADNLARLAGVDPVMPSGVKSDRARDNWRPLLAIAEVAGGKWPDRAREAAVKISATEAVVESFGMMLLEDIRAYFGKAGVGRVHSRVLVRVLAEQEERPWGELLDGKPLSPSRLSKMLRPFGIGPDTIRIEPEVAKGYSLEKFSDAFARYLLPLSPLPQTVTPLQTNSDGPFQESQTVTKETVLRFENPLQPTPPLSCNGVTAPSGGKGRVEEFGL